MYRRNLIPSLQILYRYFNILFRLDTIKKLVNIVTEGLLHQD